MTGKSALKLFIGLVITGVFVTLILRQVDFAELKAAVLQTRFDWIAVAVAAFLAGYSCRIFRWQAMLRLSNPQVSWGACAVPFLGSIAVNNVLPFRAGDAMRALAFSGWLDVPRSALLATLLVERLLDMLSLLLFLGVVLLIFDLGGAQLAVVQGLGATGLIGLGAVIMVVLLFPKVMAPVVQLLVRMIAVLSPGIAARIGGIFERIFTALSDMARGRLMSGLMVWSLAVWTLEGTVFWAAAQAVPGLTETAAAWLALPVGTLSTLLPSTPGYIGTFHFFVKEAMELLGNPAVAAAAFAVVIHAVLWVLATGIGGVCMIYWTLRRDNTPSQVPKDTL